MKNKAAATTLAVLIASCLVGCGKESPQALIASAKASMAKNDNKTALIQIKNALQADPNSGEGRFLLGSVLFEQGDFEAADLELHKAASLRYSPDLVTPKLAALLLAESQYKTLIDNYGNTHLGTATAKADLDTSLAYAYAMQGRRDTSDAMLKAALAADPNFEPALVAQARFVARDGDADRAIELADKVLQRNPRSVEALRLQGDVRTYLKSDLNGALVDYRKALELDPNATPVHLAIMSILMTQHKTDETDKQLAQLRKVTGNTVQVAYIEALIAYARKNTARAHELALQLLKLAPDSPSILLLAGGVELQDGSLLQAQTYLEHALKIAPRALTARRMLIMSYLRANQPDRAMATLIAGETSGQVPPELYAVAAETYMRNGDVKTAEELFAKAAKQDPDDANVRTSLALAHMVDGQAPLAFEELQGIAASDKGTSADLALISAYMKRGDHEGALRAIDALERKEPGTALPSDLRGRVQLSMKDAAAARRSFEKALTIAPTYYPAVATLASLDLQESKPTDARKRLEAFAAANPKNSGVLMALSQIPGTSNETAEDYLKKAIEAGPTLPAPPLLLIRLYLSEKNLRMAVTTAQNAVAALPDQPNVLQALGAVQQESGSLNQAIATFGKLVQLVPGSPEPLVRLADAQQRSGDKDAAGENLRKALAIKPDLIEAQRRLAAIEATNGDTQGAIDIAHTIQKQHPTEPVGFALEGDLAAQRHDLAGAVKIYREGLRQTNSTELAEKLYSMLLASGADAEARAFDAEWRKAHPKDSIFVFRVGDLALARGDLAAAEASYAAVLKLQPDNAAAFNNLAWVASIQHKPEALTYAEKANQLAPNQPPFMDTMAIVLGATGQVDKAIELQKKVVDMVPTNDGFRLDLAKLYLRAGKKSDARAELDKLAALGKKFPGQAEVASLRKDL